MPDPDEAVLAEVHGSSASLLDKIKAKGEEIAAIGADLRTARAALAAAKATGDQAAARRSESALETLSGRAEAARTDRLALDEDHARLVERLALLDSCDAPADVPLLLLPVRVETRFNADATQLRIRIYPDEIHVDRLDRGLSASEASAGQAYWTRLWAGGIGDAAEAASAESWKQLLTAVGAARAHWVARTTTPTNVDQLGTGAPVFPEPTAQAGGAALARLLPDRFVAMADQGGNRSRAVGSAIPPEVRIGLLSLDDEPMVDKEGLKILPGTEWLADYDAAVAKGLALTLTLARPGKVDRLVVTGVQRSRDPAGAAADFSALLEAHWESDGLAFLPQGTPTNNTEIARSAWQRKIAQSAPPAVPMTAAANSNAAVLTNILGIDAPWLATADHAQEQEQADAAAMNTALWPATLGQFLDAVDEGSDAISPVVIEQIRSFHRDHVRGRGPVPSLRIGSQPYGILPVSSFAAAWKDDAGDKFGAQLTGFLRKLRPNWMAATGDLAHIGSGSDLRDTMDRILGQSGVSYGVRARRCLSGSMVGAVAEVTGTAKAATDIESLLTRMLQEAIGNFSYANLGATLDDKSRAILLPYADDTRDPAFLTALLANGSGGNISSVFQALIAIAADLVAARPRPGRDFVDHFRDSAAVAPAVRDAIITQITQPANTDFASLERLRAALPGADDPAARPAARSFAMDGTHEPSFATYFDNVSSAASRDYLSVLVADEFLRTGMSSAEFRAALDHLAKDVGDAANQARHILVGETLDGVSHRLDSWITGTVSRRMATQRTAKPVGLTIGAFGYVENLQPEQRPQSGGFILAPSLGHATTAGILRAAHLSYRPDPGARNPYAIGLSSARVRDALHLIDGIRQGQPLGALLGYRIERALQDATLGHLVLSLRSLAPLTQGKLSDRGDAVDSAAQEAIAASNVTDGLRLVELWRSPTGAADIQSKLNTPPTNNPYFPAGMVWPTLTAANWTTVDGAIRQLDASVDAVADMLLAESVHQVAQGNLARASAAMDAAGRGDVAPPEPDFVNSARGGQPVSHRLLIIGRDGGWNRNAPRAKVAPGLEGWAAERLGDPSRIVAGFSEGGEAVRLALGTIAALDLVALSSDIQSAARRATGNATFDPALPADPRLAAGDTALADALVVADGLRRLLSGARVAGGSDFGLPGAPPAHTPDLSALTALAAALDDAALMLKQRRDALSTLIAAPQADLTALSNALVAVTDFGIATPSVSAEQLGETALLAAAEADGRITAYATLAAAPIDPEALAQRATALLGHDFVLPIPQVPTTEPSLEVALDPIAPASIRRYLGDIATVRPQVRLFTDHLMLCDAIGLPPRLAVMQLGGEPGRWVAHALPEDAHTPDAAIISIIADAPETPPATFAGLVIDDWTETFPRRALKGEGDEAKPVLETTAGVAIHANAPNAQPPQTMLLGISPDGARWNDERVFNLLTETMDMARMRLVTLETLPLAARILPAIYTQSWSLQGQKTIDWSKFGDVFLKASIAGAPLRAFAMVEEN
ncbi:MULTISPECIES: hypothetical protein [unclassified Novosphingobium]|uniref:hypothetical protein n=1 Tax=unclassified Novosphingobium TaxID=2644732 RepID=UPI0013574F5C|nr:MULTISPECIES: hypothetical protein [unclassified Novosphingobium]